MLLDGSVQAKKNKKKPGTLVLDEVHKGAGNKSTKTYQETAALLAKAVGSPLLAMSATFASDVEGLRMLAPRLGLVGDACTSPYATFDALKKEINSKKETGLELLTAHLSKEGLFMARCISYHGTRAEHLACTMDDDTTALYGACAGIYADLEKTELFAGKHPRGYFLGSQVRFFKALTLRAKLPDVIERTEKELAAGRQVVLSVLGTSEAALKRADDDEIEESGGVSALRDEALSLIAYGRTKCGTPTPEQLQALKAIKKRICALDLGNCGALDALKDALKAHGVAELTGRSQELVYDEDKETWVAHRVTKDLVGARARFQAGELKVALVSAVAATGISLHDTGDEEGVSRPRTMILFELPWAASQALQLLGRVHRSAQQSAPLFITTAVSPAEQRFSSAVARRLKLLGALTTGDQRDDGGSNIQLDGEQLLSAAGNRAARVVGAAHEMMGVQYGRQLLNRALALSPTASGALIQEFFDETAKQVQVDVQRGKAPMPRALLVEDGVKTRLTDSFKADGVHLEYWTLDRRLTWKDINARRHEIVAAGRSEAVFSVSNAPDAIGLCLAHYREDYAAVRCHFVDGRVASVLPAKVMPVSRDDIKGRWKQGYTTAGSTKVIVANVPCFEALQVLWGVPKAYRVQRLDGTRSIGIGIPDSAAYRLRDRKSKPKPPAKAPVAASVLASSGDDEI